MAKRAAEKFLPAMVVHDEVIVTVSLSKRGHNRTICQDQWIHTISSSTSSTYANLWRAHNKPMI